MVHYYIPIQRVEGWDGHILWLKITEAQIKEKYERSQLPALLRYYIKDYHIIVIAIILLCL